MAVPDYETLMLPILQFLSDGQEQKTSAIVAEVSSHFNLSEDERRTLIPSGRAKLVGNRVGWACTYLRKAGLISSRQRGVNRLTDDGVEALAQNPTKIDGSFLAQYEQFEDFRRATGTKNTSESDPVDASPELTPEEIIGNQSEVIHNSIKADLLDLVGIMDADSFEQLVVDLLIAMGYGGSAADAGRAVGRTNDGGIDGVINEDVLGLDTIYIQAKRWKNTVPIKEVRDFAGALLAKRSNKGVFITTSDFPQSAKEYVSSIDRKIVLIDGERLTSLMTQFNLGVTTKNTIAINEIDSDYFTT